MRNRNAPRATLRVSMRAGWRALILAFALWYPFTALLSPGASLPANQWVELCKDPVGARRGSSIRYAPDAGSYFLWGFMDSDPELLQEQPLIETPEYDIVAFDPAEGRWRNHLPRNREAAWSKKLPLAYVPRTYAGITTGSERTVLRGPANQGAGTPRPDLNIVFDQVTYHPGSQSLFYFTGGLTAAYDVLTRHWSDLAPAHSPPPVVGGSMAHDPIHDEIVLFGGGHIAERDPNGGVAGYTGTWLYRHQDDDWRRLQLSVQPSPRMNTRMVCDTRNQVLVVFGGDGQSHYLADTWLYDLKTRTWRASKAPGGPAARAGHFTVYDPETGRVIIGGGYNRTDLTDMWAYDAAADRWQRMAGEVPIGFYLTADIAPEKRLILLVTNTRRAGDTMTCNILYPVRTTYGYRIEEKAITRPDQSMTVQQAMPKRPLAEGSQGIQPDPARQKAQAERLRTLAVNRWVPASEPGRTAPDRTWGTATFDRDRGRVLYWGGEHCGYEGSDVEAYDIGLHTWISSSPAPEYPERLWNHAVRLAGVTFQGGPWTVHGRRIYAYDPVSHKMIMVRPVRLTTGYSPEPLRNFPGTPRAHPDAVVNPPSSYYKYATWAFDPDNGHWELLGGAPAGLDTLLTTPHGVMGVNADERFRLNDAGYPLPWTPSRPAEDTSAYLFDAAKRQWIRLGEPQSSPQNLYGMTGLAYDTNRSRIVLHGGGQRRDELWTFDLKTKTWQNMQPKVVAPNGSSPPVCSREAVYVPGEDVVLIHGSGGVMWEYRPAENVWRRVDIPASGGEELHRRAGQNHAMVYDPNRDLVLLILGSGGDNGRAFVYFMRYKRDQARFVSERDTQVF